MTQKLIYVTSGNISEAEMIAKTLVEERLVACANVLPGMKSFYWWEGAVQEDPEVLLIMKTHEAHVETVIGRVKELHSYDCPCVVSLSIEAGNPAFLKWIADETLSLM